MFKYKIVSQEILNRNVIHAVLTHLFDKQGVEKYRIKVMGPKVLLLFTHKNLETEYSYQFASNGITKTNKISVQDKTEFAIPKELDSVTITGEVSYSKTLTVPLLKDGKMINKIRPVSFYARNNGFIEDEGILKTFIEESLGITPDKIEVIPSGKIEISKNKTIFDAFSLKVEGKVKDLAKVQKLFMESVGSSKSYGFGSMDVESNES